MKNTKNEKAKTEDTSVNKNNSKILIKLKSILTIRGLLLAMMSFIVIFALFYYFNKSFGYFIGSIDDHAVVMELENGVTYTQNVDIYKKNLKSLELHFDTNNKINEGIIKLAFNNRDGIIEEWEVDASSLIDNEYYVFKLNTPIYIEDKDAYTLNLTYNYNGDNKIGIYTSLSNRNIKSNNGSIDNVAINTISEIENTNAKKTYDALFIVLAVIVFLFLIIIVDINSYSIIKAAVVTVLLLICVRVVRYDLFDNVQNSTTLVEYNIDADNDKKEDKALEDNAAEDVYAAEESEEAISNSTTVIKSTETREFLAAGFPKQFSTLSFFIEGTYNNNVHVTLKGFEDNKVYFDSDIDNKYITTEQAIGKIAVQLYSEKDFPQGNYKIVITNNGENDFVVDTLNDITLNITARKETYVVYGIAIIILFVLALYFIYFMCVSIKKYDTPKLFLSLVIPLSLIYLIIFLPWSQPDTKTHFLATYRLSNLLMGYGKDMEWYGRQEDAIFIEQAFADQNWEQRNPCLRDYTEVIYNAHIKCTGTEMVDLSTHQDKMKFYSFVNYIPQILGLTLGRILGLSTIICIYLARLFIWLVYIWGTYNAVKKTPIGKGVIALIALSPMCLMMSSAISYDALVIIASLNFISSILSLYDDRDNKKKLIEVLIWTFIIGSIKAGGFLILLPFAFILFDKVKSKNSIIKISSILGAGIFAALLFDVIVPAGSKLFQFGTDNSDKLSASFAIHNPLRFFDMASKSYLNLLDMLAINTSGTHLGWLENTIPATIIVMIIILTGLYSMFENDSVKLKKNFKYIFGLIIAISVVSTPIMLMSWTSVGSSMVNGLQGRYYLPLLPLVFFMLTKYNLHVDTDTENRTIVLRKIIIWFAVISAIAVYYLMRLYFTR